MLVNESGNGNSNGDIGSHGHEFRYPSHIKEYQIMSQLGKGAFGTVYEATTNNNRIAIKTLSKSLIRSRGLALRVRNEVSIHHQLRHRNILELLHFFEDEEYVYLVMELADGGELYRRVKNSSMNLGEIKKIFASIVDGLIYLHSHGIIHRDLKLSNILLSSNSIPKIADFGLAIKILHNSGREQQTLCGTPNYLAPEVILKNPYGKEADLWSLGCLLFSMIVGRPPFESTDVRDTFSRVKKADFRIPEAVPPLAQDLLKRLIVLDPSARITLEQIRRHPFLSPPPVPILSPSSLTTTPFSSKQQQQQQQHQQQLLNTKNLKPITQRTKHGLLQILESGQLLIDFDGFDDVLIIPSNSSHLELYHRPWREDSVSVKGIFDLRSPLLPTTITSRYEYGRRFVNLVRAKTAQIILATDTYKAFLMDNATPPYDFQIRYKNGFKVDYNPTVGKILIRALDGREAHFSDKSTLLDQVGNQRTRDMLGECLKQYQQCCDVAKKIERDRDNYPYPYIIREDNYNLAAATTTMELTIPQLTALVSSSMDTIYPNRQQMTMTAEGERSFEYAYKTFIPEIGWCLASPSEQFLLLFVDGQTLLIDGKKNRVSFYDQDHPPVWMRIDQHLPLALKQKLSYFPKFVNMLKSGQGHSFIQSF